MSQLNLIHRPRVDNHQTHLAMKASLLTKLETLTDRHEEVSALLGDSETIADQNKFRDLSREYSELEPWCSAITSTAGQERSRRSAANAGRRRSRPAGNGAGGTGSQRVRLEELEAELQTLLLPRDPQDSHNVFLEIRAGTGGDEAAIFSGDLFRMYSRYAENRGWKVEVLSERPGSMAATRKSSPGSRGAMFTPT